MIDRRYSAAAQKQAAHASARARYTTSARNPKRAVRARLSLGGPVRCSPAVGMPASTFQRRAVWGAVT
jgi:hypothetical protein